MSWGRPHRFEVWDEGPARMLQLTTPAQFEDLALAVGERVSDPVLPEPTEPDLDALVSRRGGLPDRDSATAVMHPKDTPTRTRSEECEHDC